ncbi:MAG: hypothetical protein QOF51_3598 [Chloroflexota bacterium]|jgi:hypothetical protein|nr:hypothetical protein [Chloroflexota bacterium]
MLVYRNLVDSDDISLGLVLERARHEPALLERICDEPVATLYELGVRIDAAFLKQLLGIQGATNEELVEVLCARLGGQTQNCRD